MALRGLGGRGLTWLIYGPTLVVSLLFCIVGLVTFGDLAQVQNEEQAGNLGSQLNGALAATFMGPVCTAALMLTAFFVLVKKSWVGGAAHSFTFGLTAGWCMANACLLLLAGVVLTGAQPYTPTFEQSPFWGSSATHAFVASYVLAFIAAAFQLALAAALVSNRRAFGRSASLSVDELGLSPLRSPGSPASSEVPVAGAPASPLPATRPAPGGGAWNAV